MLRFSLEKYMKERNYHSKGYVPNWALICDRQEVLDTEFGLKCKSEDWSYTVSKDWCIDTTDTKDMKVVFNDPATILFVNGKKYVAKAHNEKFDSEKGLLMCLAKANGITHLELKRMIKRAKTQEKKETKKKTKK